MNIEQLTQAHSVSGRELLSEISNRKSPIRNIGDFPEGHAIVVPVEEGGSALMFVREESDFAEFVCAGKIGGWMKTYLDEWLIRSSVDIDLDAAPASDIEVSSEHYAAAVSNDFRIHACEEGVVEFLRVTEDYYVSLSNDADIEASANGETWLVSRTDVKHEDDTYLGNEVGVLMLAEPVSLEKALDVANCLSKLKGFTDEDASENQEYFVFETLFDLTGELEDFAPDAVTETSDMVVEAEMEMQPEFSFM